MKKVKLRTHLFGEETGYLGVSAQIKMLCTNPPHKCKFQNILVQNITFL